MKCIIELRLILLIKSKSLQSTKTIYDFNQLDTNTNTTTLQNKNNMKLLSTTLLTALMAVVPYQNVQAMSCSNVCPNEDSRGCWRFWGITNRMCQAGGPNDGCNAWCFCDMFGRNCAPCGSCSRSAFDTDVAAIALEEDDYYEWMAMSDNEKESYVSSEVCGSLFGKVADGKLHKALEDLADTNHDGFLSRQEYDNAHYDTTAITDEHCIQQSAKRLRGKKDDSDADEPPYQYQPDSATIEAIEEEEIRVLRDARAALEDIVHSALDADFDDGDMEPPSSSLTLMKQRKLVSSSCSPACQACKVAADVKFLIPESTCLLGCEIAINGRKCKDACRTPRRLAYQACEVLP